MSEGNCPRSSQLKETMKWVDDNFETRGGALLARHSAYEVYLNFCDTLNYKPVPSASFGKLFRQRFPDLVTRRLGNRGQSKYHYQGVDIKSNSPYKYLLSSLHTNQLTPRPRSSRELKATSLTSKQFAHQVTSLDDVCLNTPLDWRRESEMIKANNDTKKDLLTIKLPDFPNVSNFRGVIDVNELNVFMVMYRAHCERLLDMALIADFEEMRRHLIHFWQTFPTHLNCLISLKFVIDLIGVCDVLTYGALNRAFIPSLRVEIHQSIRTSIRSFVTDLPEILATGLKGAHAPLKDKKIQVALRLKSKVEKELKVSFLSQTCKELLRNTNNSKKLLFDLRHIDQTELWYRMDLVIELERYNNNFNLAIILKKFYADFQVLLEEYITVRKLLALVEKVFDVDVEGTILPWFYFLNLLSVEITLKNAPSFDVFGILRLLMEEYALARLENIAFERYQTEYLNQLNNTYFEN